VIALVVVFVGYQAQATPKHLDPVASSVASYDMRALAAGGGTADVAGQARLTTPSTQRSGVPASKPKQSAHTGSTHNSTSSQAGATRSAASKTAATPATPALACSGTGGAQGTGMRPYNYAAIVNFLVAHGYTKLAAVGIAGNIYQESDGNPESVGTGGGGLIGWTPLPSGFVTGNPAADLQTQLAALLTYNQGWAQYIPTLNAATSASGAADIYMTYFERPGFPAASNREGAAVAVAQACGIS
jgi:hypothetical protein